MEQNNYAPRTSKRLKKTPVTANEDLFLDNQLHKKITLGTSVIHIRGQTPNKFFKLFHQNIRGLRSKTSEILCHLYPDLPHLLCFSERHMSQYDVDFINIEKLFLRSQVLQKEKFKEVVYLFNPIYNILL
jgi:hypothetical protein